VKKLYFGAHISEQLMYNTKRHPFSSRDKADITAI